MKRININLFSIFFTSLFLFAACKKDDKVNPSKEVIETNDYIFNTATKTLSPQTDAHVNIVSELGVESIYSYLIRGNKPDSLINVYLPSKNENVDSKEFEYVIPTESFSKADLSQVSGIKLMIKRSDNSSNQELIKLISFTPETPKLTGFATKLVAVNNVIKIEGVAASANGLKKIEILDDAEVSFKVVHTISTFTSNSYNLNYDYTIRDKAKQVRVILTDNSDYKTQVTINVEATAVTGPFKKYENVVMNAQGVPTNNAFIGQTGTFLSSCDLPIRGLDADIFLYTTGLTGTPSLTFYAAGGAQNIVNGFKCDDIGWTLLSGQALKQSKLRVMEPTNNNQKRAYEAVAANSIPDLSSTGLLAGVAAASSNTAKFVDNFDATTKNLILVQTPGSKNILIKIKSVAFDAANAANASITMDIYVEN